MSIERELFQLGEDVEKFDVLVAWHAAQRDWRKTQLTLSQARAQMEYGGPATKSKAYAITRTEKEQINLDIAVAQLGLCEKTLHYLDKKILTTLGRNKSAGYAYNTGY